MSGSELVVPIKNKYTGGKKELVKLDDNLKRNFRAIEDWAHSPFVSSAHIQNAAITNAHIADATIDAAKITDLSADKITSGTLTAEILLANTLRTGVLGERRVEISDSGVVLLDSDDSTVVSLPTDPDQPAYFRGSVIADAFQVHGDSTIEGTQTVGVGGGTIVVGASVGQPNVPPAINSTGLTTTSFNTGNGDIIGGTYSSYLARRGLWWDGSNFRYSYYNSTISSHQLVKVATNGLEVTEDNVDGVSAGMGTIVYLSSTNLWYGFDRNAGDIYTWGASPGGANGAPSGSVVHVTSVSGATSQLCGDLTTDGTDLFVAVPVSTGNVNILRYTVTPANLTITLASSTVCNYGHGSRTSASIRAFFRGSGDLGGTRNIFQVDEDHTWANNGTANTPFYVFNTSGTRQTSEEWTAANYGGLVYQGGSFREMSRDQYVLYTHGSASSGFTNSTYWIAYTFYDNDSTGGTHESSLSPRSPFTGGARRSLQITWPTIPDMGGTDDPNSVRLYVKLAASDPGSAFNQYFRQGTNFSGTTTTLTTYNTGTAGAQDTVFPNSGTPGEFQTQLGSFLVRGDGKMVLPTFSSDPGSPTNGQIYYNSASGKARVYNGIWNDLY